MGRPIRYEDLEDDRRRMAARMADLGISPASARGRLRDPDKAALLRAAGVPEERIGPVGPRRFFSAREGR